MRDQYQGLVSRDWCQGISETRVDVWGLVSQGLLCSGCCHTLELRLVLGEQGTNLSSSLTPLSHTLAAPTTLLPAPLAAAGVDEELLGWMFYSSSCCSCTRGSS